MGDTLQTANDTAETGKTLWRWCHYYGPWRVG